MAKNIIKKEATPVITKSLGELSQEELVAVATQLQEQNGALEKQLADSKKLLLTADEKIAAAEAKVAVVTKDATDTINSLSIEVAKHTSRASFKGTVVKHGKKLVELTVPKFNLNGKNYVSEEIADDDPVLDELEEIGSSIYKLTSSKKG